MAPWDPSDHIDTVVVGNGPSALILSFMLHGNIPYYDSTNPHPDPILHQKLQKSPCLLDIEIEDLASHFDASRISYSTQALPINVLLDTLLRPLADTDPGQYECCVRWEFEPEKSTEHLVLGNTAIAGGQWADNPVAGSWDIRALSYAEMLSLPRYGLLDHLRDERHELVEDYHRPSRREVAEYLKVYPAMVGIEGSVYTNSSVEGVSRTEEGFFIKSHNLRCKHLVLASGTFSNIIPARPLLRPVMDLPNPSGHSDLPLLVVGSGFTAADVILSTPSGRKIIHIFKWAPDEHPSPLRACHPRAYPEYASIYRRMKIAAKKHLGSSQVFSPTRKKSNPFERPDWEDFYEGLPNTYIRNVETHEGFATITLEDSSHKISQRQISGVQYVIGRRGSLEYLEEPILSDVLGDSLSNNGSSITGRTLRRKAEENLEVARDVFITGSLTGDSLIRFAFGGCIYAAREIMRRTNASVNEEDRTTLSVNESKMTSSHSNCMDGVKEPAKHVYDDTNGHSGLEIDMKSQAVSVDFELKSSELWTENAWWSGGCNVS